MKKNNTYDNSLLDYQTAVVHDSHDDRHHGAVAFPIYQNSLFTFPTHDAFDMASSKFLDNHVYTRGNNPSVFELEKRLALLEDGEKARCFASGMAAISAAILSTIQSGDHVICVDEAYGVTKRFLNDYLSNYGIETTFVDGASIENLVSAVRPNTKLIYLESPTSMVFKLQDLKSCAQLAKKIGAITIIDNTWASPCFQNPLQFDIDLVIHSISKYIGGHSDLVGGVVIGSAELIDKLSKNEFLLLGGIMTPHTANQVMRSLRTLPLRMEKLQANGLYVAKYLEQIPFITKVNHPGLPSHEQYSLVHSQMKGLGSLFSFETTLPYHIVRNWGDKLTYFRIGVSWGGYESLIIVTKQTTDQKKDSISLVRIYIGLENPQILVNDMLNAFKEIGIYVP
ncbi:cystathionine beta-lyase [Paenibacillus selenitireducens]|uniref:homocysteine desulfhydrase n=1 Tax=Paenibacillus selenitireducens TaxID=1324314 RepID=A0A1T2XL95_9BACL|nr:aminotransferase class I/II-fold pyridoxal phosphate-dependent enzyme [Paenibacillus selenitireducens]OPA80585.1 cystathionine beta-lyase [Paenibacillus selenitireducens]